MQPKCTLVLPTYRYSNAALFSFSSSWHTCACNKAAQGRDKKKFLAVQQPISYQYLDTIEPDDLLLLPVDDLSLFILGHTHTAMA